MPGSQSARSFDKTQQKTKKKYFYLLILESKEWLLTSIVHDNNITKAKINQFLTNVYLATINKCSSIKVIQEILRNICNGIWISLTKTFIVKFFLIQIELTYNTQKLYEDYYYKKTNMECNFKYKRNTKSEREFYTTKRK